MKLSKVMKRIAVAVMVCAIVFSGFGISMGTSTVKASTEPVKMYYCDYVVGKYSRNQYVVYIQINSNAQNKAVYVHYNNDTSWEDEAATYVTTLEDGSQIWKADVLSGNTVEYAIKYVGDGQTYWDNNNGNNYTQEDVLGTANLKIKRANRYASSSAFNIPVVLKNLAYNKVVKVRYTLDNWATYQDVALEYVSSDTEKGTELWQTVLSYSYEQQDSFQYCVYYQVNGKTYWDNNFGINYNKNYTIPNI